VADFGEYRDVLKEINAEFGKNISNVKEATKAINTLGSVSKTLQNQEEAITRLTDKQLDAQRQKAEVAVRELRANADKLAQDKSLSTLSGQMLARSIDRQLAAGKLTEEEANLLRAREQGFAIEQEILDLIDKEVEKRKASNSILGVTGNLLKGAKEILGGSIASALKLDDAFAAAQKKADSLAESVSKGEISKGFAKLQVAATGIGQTLKGLATTLTDPFVIISAIIKSFTEFTKANADLRNLTGQTASNFETMDDSITTSTDQIKTMVALTNQLGINVNAAFSKETIKEATELVELQGLSADLAGTLALRSEAFGTELADVTNTAIEITQEFARTGKGALAVGKLVENIAKVSPRIALSLSKNPKALASAVAQAQALGAELSDIEGAARNLLNFEEAISKELEAELLTGMQINGEKFRQLALNGELEDLAAEFVKDQALLNRFQNGTLIQQDAIAASMGLTSDKLAQMITNHQINLNMTDEEREKADAVEKAELRRLEIMDQFKKVMANLVEIMNPYIEKLTAALSNTEMLKGAFDTIRVLIGAKILQSVLKLGSAIKGAFGGKIALMIFGSTGGIGSKAQAARISRAGRTMTTFGTNVGAAGASAAPAIPVILSLSAAIAAIGFALGQAAPAISAFGDMFKAVLEGIGSIIESIGNAITGFIKGMAESITELAKIANVETAAGFTALGLSFLPLSIGLGAMAIALTALGNPLAVAGAAVAEQFGFGGGGGGEEKKSGGGIGAAASSATNSAMLAKLDQLNDNVIRLIGTVQQGNTIVMDGSEVGRTIAQATSELG